MSFHELPHASTSFHAFFTRFHDPPCCSQAREAELEAARSSLAQLYGDATRLVERGLDSIQTVDLVSGRQDAREARKALVGRLEDLALRAKSQLGRCDKLMDAQHSALANDAEELD